MNPLFHHTYEQYDDVQEQLLKIKSPNTDVELSRVSRMFPSFSSDGSKLAFVDNDFKSVWVAHERGLQKVYQTTVCFQKIIPLQIDILFLYNNVI